MSPGRTVQFFSARLSTKPTHHAKQISLESSEAKYGEIMVKMGEIFVCECHWRSDQPILSVSVNHLQ